MKNNLIKIIWTLIFSIFVLNSFAQQDLMLTQYSSALQLTNPAYVGTSGRLNATGIIRNQWVGFEGAPQSQVLLINTPFLRYKLGLGLGIIRDQIGPSTQTQTYIDFSYNFHLNAKVRLALGLSGGFNIQKVDFNNMELTDANDPAFSEAANQLDFSPNFGFGMYMFSEKFYLGLSTPKLLKNEYNTVENISSSGGEERHFFVIGGYLFKINETWQAKPSFSLKMVKGSPLSVDVTANAIYDDKYWFGLMFRYGDAIGFIFQYQITKQLRAGYSYDLPLTQMLTNSLGSHEILISFDMIFKDRKIVTPRYF